MPFWIAKREQLVVDSAVSSQVGLLATRVASAIDGLRETGSPTPGTACRSVVLVGERGVGKTSLLNLLLRLGEPQPEPPPIGPVEPKSRKGPPTDAELEAVGVLNEEFAAGGADEAPPLEKAATLFVCVLNSGACCGRLVRHSKQRVNALSTQPRASLTTTANSSNG